MGNGGERREAWGSRIGLILAAAGNAIGIGNLLRFPSQAAQNGGGAFMVPYVVCLVLFGLPMMWVAWTIGRYGGKFGHGTTPGMFDRLWPRPISKYLGVLGVAIPLLFCLYYTYIEAWCLGYSYFSLTGDFSSTPERQVDLGVYFQEFLGSAPTDSYFPGVTTALVFLIITLALNILVLYRGVAKGIEILAKVAIPLLFLFCLILAVRVFTTTGKAGSAVEGLSYLWTPDFGKLGDPKVWVAAAGQIFFTLSIGIGSLECYASYLRQNDDIALTGLTTASTNEFVEIIFGSLIAIPAAAVFFGRDRIEEIASGGAFDIGMISMPEVLRDLQGVQVFGTIWFLLLFLAAFTSSVAVCQPVMAFLQDEARLERGTAAAVVGIIWFLGSLPVLYFLKYGVLDEMDFWAGTIGLVVFSTIEVVLFAWIFKLSRGWEELHRGADIRVPRVFYPIILVVTPVCLLAILGFWFYDAIDKDQLVPKPTLNYQVVNRGNHPGEFKAPRIKGKLTEAQKRAMSALVDGATPEEVAGRIDVAPETVSGWLQESHFAGELERRKDRKRAEAMKKTVAGAAERARRDLRGWAEVRVADDGRTLSIARLDADPRFEGFLSAERLEEFLALDGFGYQERVEGETVGRARTVTVAFEALHTAPFIWLTRVLIVAITLAFMLSVRVIWKTRAAAAGARGGE